MARLTNRDPARFWDRRARENAFYFVDNELDYRHPDEGAFWDGGDEVLDRLTAAVGLEIGPQDCVLDIGCGVGRTTRALAKRARRVIALDVSREMLDRARKLNPQLTEVEWVHGDGRTLRPLADASVDGCFSWVVLQHVPDEGTILGYIREMGRVLRPGGWAVFQVSTNPEVHHARIGLRQRLLALTGAAPRGQRHAAWLGSSVEVEALRAVVEDSGFEIEAILSPGGQFTTVRAVRQL